VAVVAVALALFPGVLLAKPIKSPRREAALVFSNGKVLRGTIMLTPGVEFRLVGIPTASGIAFGAKGKFGGISSFNLNVVREMTFTPLKEVRTRPSRSGSRGAPWSSTAARSGAASCTAPCST
jgi:hypothetical protein